jgi:hypothetical protein
MHITRYETRDYLEGEKIIDIDKASGIGDWHKPQCCINNMPKDK